MTNKCEKSPAGKHEWVEVEENRARRNDWGCIPGMYCAHCGEKRKTITVHRQPGDHGMWPPSQTTEVWEDVWEEMGKKWFNEK